MNKLYEFTIAEIAKHLEERAFGPDHTIEVTETAWHLEHPLRCRLMQYDEAFKTMLSLRESCAMNLAMERGLADSLRDSRGLGRFVLGPGAIANMTADQVDQLYISATDLFIERVDQSVESATLAEFVGERRRAHQKHGENSQEGNPWDSRKSLTILVEEVGEVAKVFNERDLGNLTDVQAQQELRKELIQTGAMCLVWVINIETLTEEPDDELCSFCGLRSRLGCVHVGARR